MQHPTKHDWTLTWGVVLALVVIVVLDAMDRAAFQNVPHSVLAATADCGFWTVASAVLAIWLALALYRGKSVTPACGMATGLLAAYGIILAIWGLSMANPVSLLGPGMLLVVAFFAFTLTTRWAIREV